MSILLKALKKSEAQRQLGQTPGIHTTIDVPEGVDAVAPQWMPLSLLAVSAIVIAWMVWHQYRDQEPLLWQMEMATAPAAVIDPAGTPTSSPAATTPAEAPKPGKSTVAAVDSQENDKRKQQLNESFSKYEGTAEPAVVKQPNNSQPAIVSPAPVENVVVAPVAAAKQAASADRPARQTAAPIEPSRPEPISFWQVPQLVRDDLPEFRVSVLVYAEEPEDRFLVVNGVRLLEKGELSEGCVLEEIRRDGAIFTYKKYRFLVKG